MPTVSVVRDRLFEALGQQCTDEEFDELCFEYGLELDDVVVEKTLLGGRARKGVEAGEDDGEEETVYKVDVPANRYDLLCLEGLVQALRIFKRIDPGLTPLTLTEQKLAIEVLPETKQIRQFVVSAVLRDISLDMVRYQSLIDLQDKLHQNICRRRTLVAIGTHDLDKIEGPFTYEARPPKDIRFVPLAQDREFDAAELMEFYESDLQLKKYLSIIRDAPNYPVIYDKNRSVCSMPPIINGDLSKITLDTKNIFIECTATDETKAQIVLNVLVAMFSRYCAEPFHVEPVAVRYLSADGGVEREVITPNVGTTEIAASAGFVRGLVGADIATDEIVDLLSRMMLEAEPDTDGDNLKVRCPVVRPDVLHACDVAEDVAVAYGFNNVQEQLPSCFTTGAPQALNQLTDLLRREALAQQGYTEVLTWVTVSHAENFDMLQRVDDGTRVAKIANPKTLEFQECRVNLLSGVLKTLRENRNMPLPIRLFEIGDVLRLDGQAKVGAVNERHLCAVYSGTAAGFEVIKALLDHVLLMVGVSPGDGEAKGTFRLDPQACEDDAFFPGRRANIVVAGATIGVIGWIHPAVLAQFSLSSPCSAFEILVEPFL